MRDAALDVGTRENDLVVENQIGTPSSCRARSPGAGVPGRCVLDAAGLGGIDGLTVGDPVTAEQMRALFGCGLHPLAELRQQQLEGPDLTPRDLQEVTQLGLPFKIVDGVVSPYRLEGALPR